MSRRLREGFVAGSKTICITSNKDRVHMAVYAFRRRSETNVMTNTSSSLRAIFTVSQYRYCFLNPTNMHNNVVISRAWRRVISVE